MQAVDGIYSPNLNEDDRDLAFLVLKFGGPCLMGHTVQSRCSTKCAHNIQNG